MKKPICILILSVLAVIAANEYRSHTDPETLWQIDYAQMGGEADAH